MKAKKKTRKAKAPEAAKLTELEQFFIDTHNDIWMVSRALFLCQKDADDGHDEDLYCAIRVAREKLDSVNRDLDPETMMAWVREGGAK